MHGLASGRSPGSGAPRAEGDPDRCRCTDAEHVALTGPPRRHSGALCHLMAAKPLGESRPFVLSLSRAGDATAGQRGQPRRERRGTQREYGHGPLRQLPGVDGSSAKLWRRRAVTCGRVDATHHFA